MKRVVALVDEEESPLILNHDIWSVVIKHLFQKRRSITKNQWDSIGFRRVFQLVTTCRELYEKFKPLFIPVRKLRLCQYWDGIKYCERMARDREDDGCENEVCRRHSRICAQCYSYYCGGGGDYDGGNCCEMEQCYYCERFFCEYGCAEDECPWYEDWEGHHKRCKYCVNPALLNNEDADEYHVQSECRKVRRGEHLDHDELSGQSSETTIESESSED